MVMIRKYVPLIVLVLLSSACSKDTGNGPDAFIDKYGGQPFQGEAIGILTGADGTRLYRWEGKGATAVMEPKGDSIAIAFSADFDDEGQVNFKFSGIQRGLDFQLIEGASYFKIVNSSITGHIKNDTQDMNFAGSVSETNVQMTVEVLFTERMNDFPAGSIMTISFDNARSVGEGNDGEGCTMRLVPIWGPNGMTMGMVPDC